MPRKTKAQIGLLLADLYAAKQDKRKAEKRVDDLEAELAAIPGLKEGAYGEWSYFLGTARELFDQPEAKALLLANGLAVPTKFSKQPMIVKPVTK
jgi:hypothetical protein